jgi:putative SOS response-associated peptidase YedK
VNPAIPNLRPSWNIAPVPIWAKDLKIGSSMINARVETAASKPRSGRRGRNAAVWCLRAGYYEWMEVSVEGQTKPRKQPYYITRKDGLPFTFAGLWERWRDGMLSFTILTTEGGAVTRHLHDRMPVILDQPGFAGWLREGDVARPEDLDEQMQLFAVSPKVNSPKYDEPDCIEPLVG